MRKLWVTVAVLGVVYLLVYAFSGSEREVRPVAETRLGQTPAATSPSDAPPTPPPPVLDVLRNKAAGDARGRVDSASTVDASSVRKLFLTADLKDEAKRDTPGAVEGYRIVVTSKIEDKPRSRLTYHAADPDRLVFINQEILR